MHPKKPPDYHNQIADYPYAYTVYFVVESGLNLWLLVGQQQRIILVASCPERLYATGFIFTIQTDGAVFITVMSSTAVQKVIGKFSFKRGVHPPHHKALTEAKAIVGVSFQAGDRVVVPMSQHLGAPCEPAVEAKQEVKAGGLLGKTDAFISAPIHCPVDGVVKEISPQPALTAGGIRKVLSVVIEAAGPQPLREWKTIPDGFDAGHYEPAQIVAKIRTAGLVGMGGAAFPTAVKLTANPKKPVDTVMLNGCECEPFLTSDHRLMVEAPAPIVAGLRLAMRACGAKRGIIAIEDNKPDAISLMLARVKDVPGIQLAICRTKYPQGGERQLIKAVLKRNVPTTGLPLDVGVVVCNVATASAITWAVVRDESLTERIVTVTGRGIKQPGNFMVPMGMLVSDLLERYCGGLTDDAERILLGGPMTGPTVSRLDVPVLKATGGITTFVAGELPEPEETACIRCGRCVDHCPIGLLPTTIAHAVKARALDVAMHFDLPACIECGCCTYVCPARIPLLQYFRSGKQLARKMK